MVARTKRGGTGARIHSVPQLHGGVLDDISPDLFETRFYNMILQIHYDRQRICRIARSISEKKERKKRNSR